MNGGEEENTPCPPATSLPSASAATVSAAATPAALVCSASGTASAGADAGGGGAPPQVWRLGVGKAVNVRQSGRRGRRWHPPSPPPPPLPPLRPQPQHLAAAAAVARPPPPPRGRTATPRRAARGRVANAVVLGLLCQSPMRGDGPGKGRGRGSERLAVAPALAPWGGTAAGSGGGEPPPMAAADVLELVQPPVSAGAATACRPAERGGGARLGRCRRRRAGPIVWGGEEGEGVGCSGWWRARRPSSLRSSPSPSAAAAHT